MSALYYDAFVSIPHLIEDAKRAMAANAQFSSLCLTLALLGNCSQVEWLKTHDSIDGCDSKAYVAWYDMWEESIKNEIEKNRQSECGVLPRLDGSFLYQIRCMVLHTTSIDIDFTNSKKITDEANQHITNFTFSISEPNEFMLGGSLYGRYSNGEGTAVIDIQGLVKDLLHLVEIYYRDNSQFFEHKGFPVNNFSKDYFERKDKR